MRRNGRKRRSRGPGVVVPALLFTLAACATAADRTAELRTEAAEQGFVGKVVPAGQFDLQTFVRAPAGPVPLVRVYIEGDGFAWVSRTQPSVDPTPRDPLAFRLAGLDPAPAVAYIGRPCQYTGGTRARGCDVRFWTSHRFAEPVVAAVDDALDQVKRQTGANRLELVGYSGGGGLAVLVAARRRDVRAIHSLAANLDIAAFTRIHRVTPMVGSLDPADAAERVADIPQWHAFGRRDTIVPAAIGLAYAARASRRNCMEFQEIPAATHADGWEAVWVSHLAAAPLTCSAK